MPIASMPPRDTAQHPPRLARPTPPPRLAAPCRPLPGPGCSTAFWAAVQDGGTPLTGPDPLGEDDHMAVTWLWRGTEATRAVQVMPNKIGDPRAPHGNLMERVPGTDVWHWTARLRRDWRGTYDLFVDEGGGPEPGTPAYWRWLRLQHRADPFNPRTLPRRWGGSPVPYAELPGAPAASGWEVRDGVPRGTVETHRVPSAHLGGDRRVWLYRPPLPAGHCAELPVLVLLDGEHWQGELGVARMLDNLIADCRIPPVAALLPDSVDSATRWDDLTCRPAYADFLTGELLPWAATRLPLTGDPARTVLAGQSLGGLTAAYAACRAPHRFGNVLAQSGSFWWPAAGTAAESEWLTGRLAASPRLPVRFRLSFGEQEWVVLPAARRLREALERAGYDDAVYREFNGGHDYLCWRTELADGLAEMLNGG